MKYLIILLVILFLPLAPLRGQEVEYVGSIDYLGTCRAVFVSGNYGYLACDDISFYIVDISDPANPEAVGNFDTPTNATDVFVVDSIAYVLDEYTGLYILDISDSHDPVFIGIYEVEGVATGLFVTGNCSFVVADDSTGYRSLQIIDVSDPSNPALLSTGQYAQEKVFVCGNYAYAPGGYCGYYEGCFGGFGIVDISEPLSPTLVGTYSTGWNRGLDIFADGNYAYFATGGRWLFHDFGDFRIVDISDGTNPTLIGTYNYEYELAQFINVFQHGNYAYTLIAGDMGYMMLVLDISSPSEPTLLTSYEITGFATEIHVFNNYIFLTGNISLTILRFIPTAIDGDGKSAPNAFSLSPNYPNPFNAATVIRYNLPEACEVKVEIYDILGRRVETLVQAEQPAGYHQVVWEAADIPSGIYFYQIKASEYSQTQKCVFLK